MTTQVAIAIVLIIARVAFKNNPKAVVYLVRASNGVDQYQTTVYDGKVTSCSCPSRKPCKHMNAVQALEDERNAVAEAEAMFRELATSKPTQKVSDAEANEYFMSLAKQAESVQPLSREEAAYSKIMAGLKARQEERKARYEAAKTSGEQIVEYSTREVMNQEYGHYPTFRVNGGEWQVCQENGKPVEGFFTERQALAYIEALQAPKPADDESDPMTAHIVNGQIVECRFSELSADEKREAYCQMFDIY